LTVKVNPSTSMVPARGAAVTFSATVNWTDPSPAPEPVVRVIQASLVVADHAQADPFTVTPKDPDPLDAGRSASVADSPMTAQAAGS
jgi:hypothetical protein